MGRLAKSTATLRIMGNDLDPDEITKLLGVEPTQAQRKGQELVGKRTGKIAIARSGMWRKEASDREPEDLDAQIDEILQRATSDLQVWRSLASRYRTDLFCGLFMNTTNEGVTIAARSLLALGERGIEIGLDIYAGSEDEE